MDRRFFYMSLLSLSVAACSSSNNKHAAGDFTYAEIEEAKVIAIPEGLKKPEMYDDFYVSDEVNRNGPVGKNVDIRAPSLVLPVASSSRVVPDTSDAIIWFDKVLEDKDLALFIYQAIVDQLDGDAIKLNTVDADNLIFESDWYHSETTSGFWLYESIDKAESFKFRYQLGTKPHGRSVSLRITLADYMRTDESGGSKEIDVIDRHRAEMAMLNEITEQVDFKYRLQQRENRLMRANQKLVTLGENPVGEPAYIVEMESDLIWSNLPIFFERHGFKVRDLNETKLIYFVDFVKPDISIWDTIWGEERPVIEIADAKYQFKLSAMGENTAVTIYDVDGNVIDAERLEKIMPVMEPGLSFRDF